MLKVEQSDGSFGGTASVSLLVAERVRTMGLRGKKGALTVVKLLRCQKCPRYPSCPSSAILTSKPSCPVTSLSHGHIHQEKKQKKSNHSYPPQPSLPHSLSLPPSFTRNPHPNPHPHHPPPQTPPRTPSSTQTAYPCAPVARSDSDRSPLGL